MPILHWAWLQINDIISKGSKKRSSTSTNSINPTNPMGAYLNILVIEKNSSLDSKKKSKAFTYF